MRTQECWGAKGLVARLGYGRRAGAGRLIGLLVLCASTVGTGCLDLSGYALQGSGGGAGGIEGGVGDSGAEASKTIIGSGQVGPDGSGSADVSADELASVVGAWGGATETDGGGNAEPGDSSPFSQVDGGAAGPSDATNAWLDAEQAETGAHSVDLDAQVGLCDAQSGQADARANLDSGAPSADAAVMRKPAPPGLTLLAGAVGGPGFLDGVGAAARFNRPAGIAVDGSGSLYVADQGNSAIRKVDVYTGTVTTIAGRGGYSGSIDGTGTAASFSSPQDLVSDGAGHLFVTGSDNNTIRRIDLETSRVTTFAGQFGVPGVADGVGAAATFGDLRGMTFGGTQLYISDYSNGLIRSVDVASASVTTLAGGASGTELRGTPEALAIIGTSIFFGADHTIRELDLPTKNVTILAGQEREGTEDGIGTDAGFYGLGGITAAADHPDTLYVTDSPLCVVRKVTISTRTVSPLVGEKGTSGNIDGSGPNARFGELAGITSDNAGNLYVSDATNSSIRKVVIDSGAVTTIAGGSEVKTGRTDGTRGTDARFALTGDVASDELGNVYVADTGNNSIRRIDGATGAVTTLAGGKGGAVDDAGMNARFKSPAGIASDGAGRIYVADTGNNTIRRVELSTGAVSTIAGTPGIGGAADGIGAAAQFNGPCALVADRRGHLFVLDRSNFTIRQIDLASGSVTTLAGSAGSSGSANGIGTAATFEGLVGIAFDGYDSLFVSTSHSIRQIAISSRTVTTLAGKSGVSGALDGIGTAARFSYPMRIAADGAGHLYVADRNNHVIRKIDIATGAVSGLTEKFVGAPDIIAVVPGKLPGGLHDPSGVAVLPTGELAITDTAENTVLLASFP